MGKFVCHLAILDARSFPDSNQAFTGRSQKLCAFAPIVNFPTLRKVSIIKAAKQHLRNARIFPEEITNCP